MVIVLIYFFQKHIKERQERTTPYRPLSKSIDTKAYPINNLDTSVYHSSLIEEHLI